MKEYLDSIVLAISTMAGAYFGSKWAHEFALNERKRDERIDSLKEVKREVMLSYRKSVDYADLFLALLYQIEKSHGAISAYSSGKLYDVVHGMKLEIMNIEDQTLELEDEDKDIEAEINHLTRLMKEDYTVMEQFLYKVMALHDSAIQEAERKDTEAKHQELIEAIRKVELDFIKVSEKQIVLAIHNKIKKM
ncbi:MAG TPA: hypothetical protein VIG45_07000 [Erysipelothrix sp.]